MRLRVIIPVLLAFFAFAGCSPTNIISGGQQREKHYMSIVSLSPNTTEIICQMGMQSKLKGRSSDSNYPPSVGEAVIISNGRNIDYDKLKSLKPDMILVDKSIYTEAEMAKIKELGVEMLVLDPSSFDNVLDYYADISSVIGNEQGASDFIDRLLAVRDTAKEEMAGKEVTAMVVNGTPSAPVVAGLKTFAADAIRSAGAEPIGPDSGKFENLTAEEVIRLNPMVIFTPVLKGEAFLKDPRFASVSAVKNKKVFEVDADVLLRAGSRFDKLIQAMNAVFQATPGAN